MLNIPTAQAKAPTVRANRQTRLQQPEAAPESGFDLGTQPASADPLTAQPTGGPGMTSLTPAAPTAYAGTTPYEYAGQGWNDPIAQDVMQEYYSGPQWNTGSAPGIFEQNLAQAQTYNDNPGVFHTSIDPASWGTTYRGQDFADITQQYKDLGGTYFNQFTPAQQAGVPYYAATGEAAPVMNMTTGVAETPTFDATGQVTGQLPTSTTGSGSFHTLAPDVINRMWR